MKELNTRRLALTYAGSFLGAGFVSGQEIWQFFGVFGNASWLGLVLTVLLLIVIGIITMLLVERTGILEIDRLLIPWDIPWLRALTAVLEIIFYFGVLAIMYAGGGALLEQLCGLPAWIGSAVMCALAVIVSISGAQGVVRVYSLIVPVMVALTVCTGVWSIVKNGIAPTEAMSSSAGMLRGGWIVGAVTYAAYNSFGIIGIMLPVAAIPHTRKVACRGMIWGGVLLAIVAGSVLGGMLSAPAATETELPMLTLALSLSDALGYCCGALLIVAMYGSALSCMVAMTNYAFQKSEKLRRRSVPLYIALGILGYLTSLGGFGDLISILYPLFGYLSISFLVCFVIHYFKTNEKCAAA